MTSPKRNTHISEKSEVRLKQNETRSEICKNLTFRIRNPARTDKNLNSRTAKDSQGLVRTCQVLDQSLPVPLLALQVLNQSWGILEIR